MNEPESISPRQRLQVLLAIPERQRTDAEWDEINELEITLTPANREVKPEQVVRRNPTADVGQSKPGSGTNDRKPARKFHKKSPRVGGPRRAS